MKGFWQRLQKRIEKPLTKEDFKKLFALFVIGGLICNIFFIKSIFFAEEPVFYNEPDGFGGIKWGTDWNNVKALLELRPGYHNSEALWIQKEARENPTLGDIPVKEIVYIFDRNVSRRSDGSIWFKSGTDQLIGVNINFYEDKLEQILLYLASQWGPPHTESDFDKDGRPLYTWNGPKTHVYLSCDSLDPPQWSVVLEPRSVYERNIQEINEMREQWEAQKKQQRELSEKVRRWKWEQEQQKRKKD